MRGLIGPPCQTIISSSFPGRNIAGIISEKSESSFAPSHSFCRCAMFWRGTAPKFWTDGCRESDPGSAAHSRRTSETGFRCLGKECLAMDPASSERSRFRETMADVPQKPSEAIAAINFFTVPTLTFGILYCFFVLDHDRRRSRISM